MPLKARRLLRRLRRFTTLPNSDRGLLWRAFVALALVDLGLRTRGFQRLIDDAQDGAVVCPRIVGNTDVLRAQRYARWLDVASRFHIVPAHCLHRSLVLHRWLLEERLPSNLRIGVRKEGSELKAHAWVELAGQPLNDAPRTLASFKPLAAADGQRPTWARATRGSNREPFAMTGGVALLWR